MNNHRTTAVPQKSSSRSFRLSLAATFTAASTLVATLACNDSPVAPSGERLSICHMAGAASNLLEIRSSQLREHLGHGDYVARLIVAKGNSLTSDSVHFSRIGDAIAAARATRLARGETSTGSCRITIAVAPGVYQGSVNAVADPTFERLPLLIDVPDVTLLGSLVMSLDEMGRPEGARGSSANSTILVARPGLVSINTGNVADKYAEPLIVVNGHPEGSRGDGTVIEGFVFQSGNEAADAIVGGNAVWAMRAQGILIRGNQIEGGFAEPIELRSSLGLVQHNYLTGRGGSCALCMFGPGDYYVIANRQVGFANRLGILVFPAIFAAVPPGVEQIVLPATALVTVVARNNELQDHQEVPFGIGLRVAAIGPGAPDVLGTARVVATDNDLSNNRFGIVVEGGFSVANTALRGNVDLTLAGNKMNASCQASMLVALDPQPAAVGLQSRPSLRNSAFTIALGDDIPWKDVWYSHPASTGNTLTVDGQIIAGGKRAPYEAAKVCSVR